MRFNHQIIDPLDPIQLNVPIGTQWNNSCTYNATITVLFNMWSEDSALMTAALQEVQSDLLDMLIQSFWMHDSFQVESTLSQMFSLEQIREFIRQCLTRISPEFSFGSYTRVHSVVHQFLHMSNAVMFADIVCPSGHNTNSCN